MRCKLAPIVIALCALFAVIRSIVAWVAWDAQLLPDSALYAAGGLGLFPSPLGRLIGLGGIEALATANALASGTLVLLVALLASKLGGSPALAALIATLTPFAAWTLFAGVDTLGTAAVFGAILMQLYGRLGYTGIFAALAILTHLATLPLIATGAFLHLKNRARVRALALVLLAAVPILLLTPYGGIIDNLLHPGHAIKVGALTVLIAFLPFLPFARRLRPTRLLIAATLGTFLAAGLQSGDRDTNGRYALPLTMVAAAIVSVPRRRERVTAGAIIPDLTPPPGLCHCGRPAHLHPWQGYSTGWARGSGGTTCGRYSEAEAIA